MFGDEVVRVATWRTAERRDRPYDDLRRDLLEGVVLVEAESALLKARNRADWAAEEEQ